jgi:hypothetical protein
MKTFIFWKRFLIAISISLIAMGICVAFLKNSLLFTQFIDPVFWPDEVISKQTQIFKSFIYSFSGTYVILWGIFLFIISKFAFKPENKWAWNSIVITTLVWFCIMCPFSFFYKIYANAIGDIIFLVFISIPLLSTRKHFYHK